MNVKALIETLSGLPQDADVTLLWDGAPGSDADGAYFAKSGYVVIGPAYEPAYYDEDRPEGAPTEEEDPYYKPIYEILKSAPKAMTPTTEELEVLESK